jgi:hypothetical protein
LEAVVEATFFSKAFEYANDRSTLFGNRAAFFFQEVAATAKTSGITFGAGVLEELGCMLSFIDERFQSLGGAPLATFYWIIGQGALVLKLWNLSSMKLSMHPSSSKTPAPKVIPEVLAVAATS